MALPSLVLAKVRSFRLQDADAHDASADALASISGELSPNPVSRAPRWVAGHHHQLRMPGYLTCPSLGPEQDVIDRDTAQTLRDLVAELAPAADPATGVIGVPVLMAVKTTKVQVSGHSRPRIPGRAIEAVTR